MCLPKSSRAREEQTALSKQKPASVSSNSSLTEQLITEAELGINELERLEKLYNYYQVDRRILRKRINKILKEKIQTTLAEVIDLNNGIEKGLSELFGYIAILKEYKTVVSDDCTQEIAFSNDKTITIPEIIITQ